MNRSAKPFLFKNYQKSRLREWDISTLFRQPLLRGITPQDKLFPLMPKKPV